MDRIIREVDYLGSKKINYTEFLAATLSISKILTNERLVALFRQFDPHDTGYITPQGIQEAIKKLGQVINKEEMSEVMAKHDPKNEGRISFEQFKQIFHGL